MRQFIQLDPLGSVLISRPAVSDSFNNRRDEHGAAQSYSQRIHKFSRRKDITDFSDATKVQKSEPHQKYGEKHSVWPHRQPLRQHPTINLLSADKILLYHQDLNI